LRTSRCILRASWRMFWTFWVVWIFWRCHFIF
jgi:hypothetical protein